MRKKLTSRTVEDLRSREKLKKPYEMFDTEIRGFLLRIEPSGTMTYTWRIKPAKANGGATVLAGIAASTPCKRGILLCAWRRMWRMGKIFMQRR